MLHLGLHFLVPALLAGIFYRNNWQVALLVMMATMLVDIDHLWADPIYDPNRCSIGFHPLHQLPFIAIYLMLCFVTRWRLVGLGLSVHMALDALDCQVTKGLWMN